MSKWDEMDMTGWVSGLTAIDEDTYRRKVVDEETASQADRPALAAKEDLGLLERRLEAKLDSIKNVEKKIDKLLSLTQNQEYIHWPGRGPILEKQMEKVEAILDGSFFE